MSTKYKSASSGKFFFFFSQKDRWSRYYISFSIDIHSEYFFCALTLTQSSFVATGLFCKSAKCYSWCKQMLSLVGFKSLLLFFVCVCFASIMVTFKDTGFNIFHTASSSRTHFLSLTKSGSLSVSPISLFWRTKSERVPLQRAWPAVFCVEMELCVCVCV